MRPSHMQYIDLTLGTPQHNLACDEALVALCESGYEHEILRFWEPREHFVVLGYSNRILSEVDLPACRKSRFPILRRCSGGGAVLQGPGCLSYALVLEISNRGPLNSISATNAFIMQRHQRAIEQIIGSKIEIQGFTDLTLRNFKFSGNAQYRRRRFALFHGTFLFSFDIPQVEKVLRMPSRQPTYRRQRRHGEFLTNLNIAPAVIRDAIREAWGASDFFHEVPTERIERLVAARYSTEDWSLKF